MSAASGAAPEVPEINIPGLDALSCQEIFDTYMEHEGRVAQLERTASIAGPFGAGDSAQTAAAQARDAYNNSLPAVHNALRAKSCTQAL